MHSRQQFLDIFLFLLSFITYDVLYVYEILTCCSNIGKHEAEDCRGEYYRGDDYKGEDRLRDTTVKRESKIINRQ